jgi:hydroxymethylpyrimidine pyrophosphatase-like HAD family hydrolase
LQVADNGASLIDPLTGCATIRRTFTKADAMHAVSSLESIASRVLVCDAGRLVPLPKNITEWDITVIMGEFPNESETMHWEERLKSDTLVASASNDNVDKWYIDCTVAEVDKAYGAAEFASNIGIEVEDLMVIGDGWNDVPMFKVAGLPIAMGAAPTELLELAFATTHNIDHNGATLAIKKYVLDR